MQTPDDARSRNMRAIKGQKTKLEESVAKALWKRGFRFRKNVKTLYGKPDLAIKKYKLVIFIDSCFWHGCPEHGKLPKNNREFWRRKLERNKERDAEVTDYYRAKGWQIKRVWEHRIKEDFEGTINELEEFIKKAIIGSSESTD